MAFLPGFTASGVEAGRFVARGLLVFQLELELLIERDEEARSCTVRHRLALTLGSSALRSPLVASIRYFIHLCGEVGLLFLTEEQTEVIILLLLILREVELLFVPWGVVEA